MQKSKNRFGNISNIKLLIKITKHLIELCKKYIVIVKLPEHVEKRRLSLQVYPDELAVLFFLFLF